jgi:hypothetical protein
MLYWGQYEAKVGYILLEVSVYVPDSKLNVNVPDAFEGVTY